MMKFQFEANGKKIEIEAAKMLDAMAEANKQFGSLPQGAWFDTASFGPGVLGYRWQTGNFFD